MSTLNYEKKIQNERQAIEALASKNYEAALHHSALAARFAYRLAQDCSGRLAVAYKNNADGWLAVAREIQAAIQKRAFKTDDASASKSDGGSQIKSPNVKLEDIFGMEEAKNVVKTNVIMPLKEPEKAKKYALPIGGGLLLYGLPGTGKTFFAKAVAGELGLPFYVIKSSDVFGRYLGESEANISKIFEEARSNKMSVIFIDEIDGLLRKPDAGTHETSIRVLQLILQEISGADSEGKNPFFLIGATNYPNKIAESGLQRFNTFIEVELPNDETRKFILKRELTAMEIPVAEEAVEFLVKETASYSCRDLINLSKYYKQISAIDNIESFTLEFCKDNYQDSHLTDYEIADEIAKFEKNVGGRSIVKKKINKDDSAETDEADVVADDNSGNLDELSGNDKAKDDAVTEGNSRVELSSVISADKQTKKEDGKVTFNDIKGLDTAKKIVLDALIDPVLYPELYSDLKIIPGSALLLYGPPGTGKTMFARAIANEMHTEFLHLTLSDLRGKNPIQTTELISSTFKKARSFANGCVVFIDDCEELLSRPGNSKAYGVSQLLNELDGIKTNKGAAGVFMLVATNRPWMIDSAILRPGRIGEHVYVGLPEKEARREIIEAALSDNLLADDVDLDKLADMTEGYSGAEIYHSLNGGGICNKARIFAKDRWKERINANGDDERARKEPIYFSDFEKAISMVTSTAVRDAERIQKNEMFRDSLLAKLPIDDAK